MLQLDDGEHAVSDATFPSTANAPSPTAGERMWLVVGVLLRHHNSARAGGSTRASSSRLPLLSEPLANRHHPLCLEPDVSRRARWSSICALLANRRAPVATTVTAALSLANR